MKVIIAIVIVYMIVTLILNTWAVIQIRKFEKDRKEKNK